MLKMTLLSRSRWRIVNVEIKIVLGNGTRIDRRTDLQKNHFLGALNITGTPSREMIGDVDVICGASSFISSCVILECFLLHVTISLLANIRLESETLLHLYGIRNSFSSTQTTRTHKSTFVELYFLRSNEQRRKKRNELTRAPKVGEFSGEFVPFLNNNQMHVFF